MSQQGTSIKVVHLGFSDHGGAGKAMVRLHLSLLEHGFDSKVLVLDKRSQTPGVFRLRRPLIGKFRSLLGRLFAGLRTKTQRFHEESKSLQSKVIAYTSPWSDYHPDQTAIFEDADMIHLHWVSGMIDYPSFFTRVSKPIIWTFHDRNPLLGGFHYSLEEDLFQKQVKPLDDEVMAIKEESLAKVENLTIVCPSNALAERVRTNERFKRFDIVHIQNALDTEQFTSKNLPKNEKLRIGLIADQLSNPWKGADLLKVYLSSNHTRPDVSFVSVGHGQISDVDGVEHRGFLADEQHLAEFYRGLDAFLLPTLEDNLPNTIMEALCCGVPVLSFETGGVVEMVEQGKNGWLTSDLNEQGIAWLVNQLRTENLSWTRQEIAQKAAEQYHHEKQTLAMIDIYQSR